MKDEIKNFPHLSGIYKIMSPTNKIYIGEAKDLFVRCCFYLNPNGVIRQPKIFNSLVKYGVEAHKIEILEFCDIPLLLERERFYQEQYDSVKSGLNCFLTQTKVKKKVMSTETKLKIGVSNKGKRLGKKDTNETLKKKSEATKGCNNPNFGGKHITKEWLLKQSISNSKVMLEIIDSITGEKRIFLNSKEAGKFYNTSANSIRECKRSGYKLKRRYVVKTINTINDIV